MPWPFDEDDDRRRGGGFFRNNDMDSFLKEFEDLHRIFGGFNRESAHNSPPQPEVTSKNPRAYFLHDARHARERARDGPKVPQDMEAWGNPPIRSSHQPTSGVVRECTSYTQKWVNGSRVTEERKERVEGGVRTVTVTRIDEDGNKTTEKRTESL